MRALEDYQHLRTDPSKPLINFPPPARHHLLTFRLRHHPFSLRNLLPAPVIHKFYLQMGGQARSTRSSKSTPNTSLIMHSKKGVAEPSATPRKSQPPKGKKRAREEDESEEGDEDLDTPTKPVLF
jgi:hypothetical protein